MQLPVSAGLNRLSPSGLMHMFMTLEANDKVLTRPLSVLEAPGRIYPWTLGLPEGMHTTRLMADLLSSSFATCFSLSSSQFTSKGLCDYTAFRRYLRAISNSRQADHEP